VIPNGYHWIPAYMFFTLCKESSGYSRNKRIGFFKGAWVSLLEQMRVLAPAPFKSRKDLTSRGVPKDQSNPK
jgi:hypothetical protein